MPAPPRRPVEAVLTAFFIAIHTRFARERDSLPPGVEVIVFCVGSEALARYDDFSGTEALIEAGRANAEAVLDFWARGGLGEIGVAPTLLVPPPVALPVRPEEPAAPVGADPTRARVPAPPA
jgi:hypothetical protein